MELGKAKLLRSGLNALHQALHPVHGLSWTDGRQVVLTDVILHNGEPRFGASCAVGQFEHVHGLSWGPICAPDMPALLAVQHKKHVTVWQLFNIPLERNRLLLSQTCELSETLPVLPQGCVWHPQQDVLLVLTKQDALLLHSVRTDNSYIKVDIKSDQFIHCACWTKDGHRMVIAAGSEIHSFIWDESQKGLNPCSFCPLFDVGNHICAIEPTLDCQVAVAAELPLDKACGLSTCVPFDAAVSAKAASLTSRSALLYLSEQLARDLRRKSIDSEQSVAMDSVISSSSTPGELAQILTNHRRSDPSPLVHLRNADCSRKGRESSFLILVTFENKVTTTRKVLIPRILAPDIVTFDPKAKLVAVASNNCNTIMVYSLMPSAIPTIQQIQLEPNERSKGLCFLTSTRLLVLVGRQKLSEPTFFPSSSSDKYIVRLVVKHLTFGEELPPGCHVNQNLLIDFDAGVSVPEKRNSFMNSSKEAYPINREHLMPASTVSQSPSFRRRLIELAACRSASCEQSPSSSTSDFDEIKTSTDSSVVVETLDAEPVNRVMSLINLGGMSRGSSRCSSPHRPPKNNMPSHEGPSHISGNLERLCGGFVQLEQRLAELRCLPKSGKKFPSTYPSAMEPPCVFITFQKPVSEGVVIEDTRAVLLCEGRLHLSTVQELFHLTIIEVKHGPSWIVLTADSDGFIPLTFRPTQEIIIRDASGHPSAQDGCTDEITEDGNATELPSTSSLESSEE